VTEVARDPHAGATASLAHLWGRLAVVEARVQRTVEARRAEDADLNDRFRGLYITDAHVDRLLSGPAPLEVAPDEAETLLLDRVERDADADAARGADLRLRRLRDAFGLDALDLELLLIVLAPDLDARFERLYAYLNDDVSRRRPTIGLALELADPALATGIERARLGPSGRLVASDLVVVDDPDRPFLTRSLRVPDRVTEHLLGHDAPDLRIRDLLVPATATPLSEADILRSALAAGLSLLYLRDRPGSASRAIAVAGLAAAGRAAVVADLARITPSDDIADLAPALIREARLADATLVAGPIEVLAERSVASLRRIAEAHVPRVHSAA
jgi:hypothetical protein